ncbi:MAG: hypothetical protein WDA03_05400 [Trueperaceae bacterium]
MLLDPTASKAPDSYVKVGRLGRTFQLEGALRVLLDDAVSYMADDGSAPVGVRALQAGSHVFVPGLGSVRVREVSETGGSLLIKLEGVRERNAAQALVNATLWVEPGALPKGLAAELIAELEAGSAEERLVGLAVLLNGRQVGFVSAAMLESANPVLEVTALTETADADAGSPRSLVPLQAPYVELTDAGVELTDPPAGLLELG